MHTSECLPVLLAVARTADAVVLRVDEDPGSARDPGAPTVLTLTLGRPASAADQGPSEAELAVLNASVGEVVEWEEDGEGAEGAEGADVLTLRIDYGRAWVGIPYGSRAEDHNAPTAAELAARARRLARLLDAAESRYWGLDRTHRDLLAALGRELDAAAERAARKLPFLRERGAAARVEGQVAALERVKAILGAKADARRL